MNKNPNNHRVSRKAYATFIERISLVITDLHKRNAMLAALDRYLDGDITTYACGLSADCAIAFEMLRFEIDKAIARSENARVRAQRRKIQDTKQAIHANESHGLPECQSSVSPADDSAAVSEPHMSRRERRLMARYSTPKTRWRSLRP